MAAVEVTRLAAVGDCFRMERMPEEVRSRPEVAAALNELRTADIAFANLEAPLTTRGVPAEKVTVIRAHPNLVEDFLDAGVDIVSTANNHMLDFGLDGLADTLATLERAGIKQVGAGPNLEGARATVVLDGPGGKVGFLAFASTLPQGYAAGPLRPGIAPIHVTAALVMELRIAQDQPGMPPPIMTFALQVDLQATVEAVKALKARCDFVVVGAHWGVSGQDELVDYQYEVGHALVDAGADMILGHHAHRLHGMEFYRGKPILYSLGNFLFGPPQPGSNTPHMSFRGRWTPATIYARMRRDSVIVDARIRGNTLERLELLPVQLDPDGQPMLRWEAAGQIADILCGLSHGMNASFRVDDGRIRVGMK